MFKVFNLAMKVCPNMEIRTASSSVTNLQRNKTLIHKRTPERVKRFRRTTSSVLKGMNKNGSNRTLINPLTYFENRLKKDSSVKNYSTTVCADCATESNTEELENQRNVSPLSSALVALDCEMVECVGNINSLARCSVVDYFGKVIVDVYVKPVLPVIDYRTRYSGIRQIHLKTQNSVGFNKVLNTIKKIIRGKIVVGHSLFNDFNVMKISLPEYKIDISNLQLLKAKILTNASRNPISLKKMAKQLLHKDIQVNEHCSVVDARTTMELFKLVEREWWNLNKEYYADFWKTNSIWMDDKYWPDNIKNE